MGLDIKIQVMSALDGTVVFDAELRQRGGCIYDALPQKVWDDMIELEGVSNYTHVYELPREQLKRANMYENLKIGYNEYTRLAWILSTLILIFPYYYTIKFNEY